MVAGGPTSLAGLDMHAKQPITDDEIRRYLISAARINAISLSEEQLQRVAVVFRRNWELAQSVMDFKLDEHHEAAPVFRA